MTIVVTPYQKAIYDVLGKLIKQEKKEQSQEQKSLLVTLKRYRTFDKLLGARRFYHKPLFYVFLGIVGSLFFRTLSSTLPSQYTYYFSLTAYIGYPMLVVAIIMAHYFTKKQRALLHFCRQCNIYQDTTNKPSVADPFVFEAVKQWVEKDFGKDSLCYAFLQQTSSIFELRVYYAMWTTKYKHTPSPKSRCLTQELYPYLKKKGLEFSYAIPKKTTPTKKEIKDCEAIQINVFSQLKESIQSDLLVGTIKEDTAKSLESEYLALENLDELKGIMWAWRKYFKDEVAIALQKSITSKCDLSWYLQEKVKLHTANLYLTKYQACNKQEN